MHDYSELRSTLGRPVSQTLDSPISLFDEWFLLCLSLAVTLIGLPYVRRNFNKGMAFHYPYRRFKMHLPGLINPGMRRRVSD